MTAKACVVDDIRAYLARIGARPIGLDGLARQIHYTASDVYAGLQYLRERDEVKHEKYKGWRSLPLYEQRILGAMK